MALDDLTIIFITASNLPTRWTAFHQEVLVDAAKDYQIISVSRKPLNLGLNILDEAPQSLSNIYFQMLRAAKLATTPYVAVAEADTLYPEVHFRQYRPRSDAFAYNINRFNVFTWGEPTYFWKDRISNSTLIAPTELLIETLEERFAKYPNGTPLTHTGEVGRPLIEKALKLTPRKTVEFETDVSVVRVDHDYGSDTTALSHRKAKGILRSYDVPYWRRAEDIVKLFI